MQEQQCFVYSWQVVDEPSEKHQDQLRIHVRAYGIDSQGQTVCLHIQKFTPYLLLEVDGVSLTHFRSLIDAKITAQCPVPVASSSIVERQKLFFYQKQAHYLFYQLRFPSIESRRKAYWALHKHSSKIGSRPVRFYVHESEASPLLQLVCERNLPTSGTIRFRGQSVTKEQQMTFCEREFVVMVGDLHTETTQTSIPSPRIMSMDLEVYSADPKSMPHADRETDCIFQISTLLSDPHNPIHPVRDVLLTIGPVECQSLVHPTATVITVPDEKTLLMEWHKMVMSFHPHVVIGYNIFGFDLPYLIARAKRLGIWSQWNRLGFHKWAHANEKQIRWSSSACPNQQFFVLDMEGRLCIDLLPIIRRDYKFSNYKLKTVSTFFLGDTKDPLTPQDIFRAYEMAWTQPDRLGICGKYCIQDASLVLRLFEELQLWIGLVEMASICNVPIISLFTQGQQIRVYSQVYKKGCNENILIENPDRPSERLQALFPKQEGYSGAYVFPPVPGMYQWVVPFDFSSLYPTTIIAYNIDYSTLVLDPAIPDSDCHIIEWEDHTGCPHDQTVHATKPLHILCGRHRYRFIRQPLGVIPSLLTHLLDMRSRTKRAMKSLMDGTLRTSLDKRQLAYKVSANSMYGAMGVQKGYLPFMPGAMCTTAMGRLSIQKAAEFVQADYKGHLIYGDSVVGSTLLLLRRRLYGSWKYEIMTIQDLFTRYPSQPYPQFKSFDAHIDTDEKRQSIPAVEETLEIMTSNGWSVIRRIIEHPTHKRLFHVRSSAGSVTVTEDHSLLRKDHSLVRPMDLTKGDALLFISPSEIEGLRELTIDYPYLATLLMLDKETGRISIEKQYAIEALAFYLLASTWGGFYVEETDDSYEFIPHTSFTMTLDLSTCTMTDVTVVPCDIPNEKRTVYDIETATGNFMAGFGTLIVKNTDSIYCHFQDRCSATSVWNHAKAIETRFLELFPSPMKLVFEEKIYKTFLILTKKRYMAYTCDDQGTIDDELTIRGVLLARRDNCQWIRQFYEAIVRLIMKGHPWRAVEEMFLEECTRIWQRRVPIQKLTLTKAVGSAYKIRPLPLDPKVCRKRLTELGIRVKEDSLTSERIERMNQQYIVNDKRDIKKAPIWVQEYCLRSQPAHVQLAQKMERRGHPVQVGSRIEYLMMKHPSPKAKQFQKIEDPDYFRSHGDILRIDVLYYLQSLIRPFDQLFHIVFGQKQYVQRYVRFHEHFAQCMTAIWHRHSPVLDIHPSSVDSSCVSMV